MLLHRHKSLKTKQRCTAKFAMYDTVTSQCRVPDSKIMCKASFCQGRLALAFRFLRYAAMVWGSDCTNLYCLPSQAAMSLVPICISLFRPCSQNEAIPTNQYLIARSQNPQISIHPYIKHNQNMWRYNLVGMLWKLRWWLLRHHYKITALE